MVKDAIARNEEIGLSIDSYMKLVNCLQKLSPVSIRTCQSILDTHSLPYIHTSVLCEYHYVFSY